METFEGKHGPLLIAEIGGNHEGNFEYAKLLTNLAIEADVDCIKFQVYTGDTIVNKLVDPERNLHFKKFELKIEQYLELAQMVEEKDKTFLASIWNYDMIEKLNVHLKYIKIGSGDLTAYPFLKKIAQLGKPIILSTGLSTEEEILDAVKFIQSIDSSYSDPNKLALLQCTSMYPIKDSDANLAIMKRMFELTRLTIGYSDHTEGMKGLCYAHLLGAQILEFHFTDSRENKVFRDHKVSVTKEEVEQLVNEIRSNNSLLGNSTKIPLPIEIENGHIISFRRAVYPSHNIKAGHKITENDLCVLRPNKGLDARDFYKLIGKVAKKNINKLEILDWSYFE